MSFKLNDDQNQIAEINMVPLIDVMLVLLIIFMIATPLIAHKMIVDLPKLEKTQESESEKKSIEITIESNGATWIDNKIISYADLKIEMSKYQGDTQINIKADRSVKYEILAYIMNMAQEQGLKKIGFVTN